MTGKRYYRHVLSPETADKLIHAALERMHRDRLPREVEEGTGSVFARGHAILNRLEACAPVNDCGMGAVITALDLWTPEAKASR